MHLTLRFLGDVPDDNLDKIAGLAEETSFEISAGFPLCKGSRSFPGHEKTPGFMGRPGGAKGYIEPASPRTGSKPSNSGTPQGFQAV